MSGTSLTYRQHTMSSTTSSSQACYQDLPQHVTERVVQHIREIITSDGYLCDLRLVNHQTNEAVLHCLAFQGFPRSFHPEHYMSCAGFCRRQLCREVGVSNEYYSRCYLQGRIMVQYDKDAERQRYYSTLGQALTTLRTDLTSPSNSFRVTQRYLNDPLKVIRGSQNPLFADKLSIILCDAVIEYSKMLNTRRAYASWLKRNIHHKRSAKFWLRNLACYLGDVDLLKHYSTGELSLESTIAHDSAEISELLGMAARRGHELIFDDLFAGVSRDLTDFEFALSGSCQSISTHIVKTIFEAVPAAQLSSLCLKSLIHLRESQRMPFGYSQIAQMLMQRLKPSARDKIELSIIIWGQANLGANEQVRFLLGRYSSLVAWPLSELLECSMSALWSACVNGNMECAEILLNAKYFRCAAEEGDIEFMCTQCCPIAMRSNSLHVYEKLSSFMSRSIETAAFEDLAGMDGTISLMAWRLGNEPKLLETQRKNRAQPHIGQVALVNAATLLRVANVKFLLERGVCLDEAFLENFDARLLGPPAFQIEWRYRRAHESEYQQVQKLLQDYGVRRLGVEM